MLSRSKSNDAEQSSPFVSSLPVGSRELALEKASRIGSTLRSLFRVANAADASSQLKNATSQMKVFIFLLVVLSLCYFSVLTTPYALSDDYISLWGVLSGHHWLLKLDIAGGRPVLGVLVWFLLSFARDIGDLRYIRLLTVIFVALLGWRVYRTSSCDDWSWQDAGLLSVTMVTLPPFQVFVSWAANGSYTLAALSASAAFYLAEASLTARKPGYKWGLAAGSVALMVLGLTINQPGAMFFWVFAAIVLFRRDATGAYVYQRLLWYIALVFAGLGVAFGVYKLGVAKYGFLLPPARSHLTADVTGKALWFIRWPLVDALNLAWLSSSPWVAACVAATVSAGMILYFHGSIRERLWQYVGALSLIPLSYLPNLVVAEDWSAYRTQVALSSLLLVYTFFALYGYTRLLRPRIANQVFTVVLGVLALAAVLLASYNVEMCFAFPQSLELRLMRSQLASRNLARVRSIYVIGATWRDSIAPTERYDEFGLPFSAQPWAPGAAVHLLLRERGGAWSKIPVEVAPVGGPITPPHGALVVDMRKLAHFR